MNPPTISSLRGRFFALAVALALVTVAAHSQVIVIDPEVTNSAVTVKAPPSRTMRVAVTVLRFIPSKATKSAPAPAGSSASDIATALGKLGQVNLLFVGDRDADESSASTAQFDSVERRPAFSLNEEANHSLTNREFGLHLKVVAAPAEQNRVKLSWNGNFSWSPDLIDAWAGEKYLLFGMKVASVLKPGSVYSDSDDDDDGGRGINIGGLFKKKPAAKPANAKPDLSFLAAEREEAPLKGDQTTGAGELVISPVAGSTSDPKHPEFLYLILRYDWAE